MENNNQFVKINLETSIRLSQILAKIYQNQQLQTQLVLKGGVATQCYLGNLKRLFLDIDLDFNIKNIDNIQKERQLVRNQLFNIMKSLNYENFSDKSRFSYSLDSLKYPYYKQSGNLDYVKIEINYSNGNHLYPTILKKWKDSQLYFNGDVLLLNLEELIGMKLAALLERKSIKDLFDIYELINRYQSLNINNIKKSCLFYFSLSSKEEKLFNFDKILSITNRDVKINLYPLLPKKCGINLDIIKNTVFNFISDVLNFTNDEKRYYQLFQIGEYYPELLFDDKKVIENAKENPIANYKIKVKKHYNTTNI